MSSFRPEAFGKYYLVDKIATGGMAEIFKAKTYSHGGFENLLVIKRILPHIGDNEDFVEMFIDEAKVSVALQHSNIVRIYDFGKILDNYFIAMECVEGKDVRNLLRKLARARKYLPIEYAAYIAHDALRGLHYAHVKTDVNGRAYGIVHRDISPSNILISYEGSIKVADFGIAKAESNAYQTRDGVLKGKYEYMSPEQAGGKDLDPRSDVFSVGIILHEMLTGRRLFKTENELATLKKIRTADFKLPSEISARVPKEMDEIVSKALARRRSDRYQSAEEMANDLHQFLAPKSADELRTDLMKFMDELFADEIADERKRLERGSEVAQRLRSQVPGDAWDGRTDSTMTASQAGTAPGTQTSITQGQALIPWLMAGGFALIVPLLLIVIALIIGGQMMMNNRTATEKTVVMQADETKGTLDIMVTPKARILVNGQIRTDDYSYQVELDPGTYTIKLMADDHEMIEESVVIEAGKQVTFQRTLKAVEKAKVAPQPSNPQPRVAQPRQPVPRPQPAGSTGKIKVTMVGVPWAFVYVNGKKQLKTAPNTYEVPAGSYEIRVENPPAKFIFKTKKAVKAGETTRVKATPS